MDRVIIPFNTQKTQLEAFKGNSLTSQQMSLLKESKKYDEPFLVGK